MNKVYEATPQSRGHSKLGELLLTTTDFADLQDVEAHGLGERAALANSGLDKTQGRRGRKRASRQHGEALD